MGAEQGYAPEGAHFKAKRDYSADGNVLRPAAFEKQTPQAKTPLEQIRLKPGITYVNDNRVEVRRKSYKPDIPEDEAPDTPEHEMIHTVIALVRGVGVKRVTSIANPSQGYLGLTELDRPDPVAAGGPHVRKKRGTSWDMVIVKRLGYSESDIAAPANKIVEEYKDHIRVGAHELHRRGEMSGDEVVTVMKRVDIEKKKANTIDEVDVSIKSSDGSNAEMQMEIAKGADVELPSANVIYDARFEKKRALPEQRPFDRLAAA